MNNEKEENESKNKPRNKTPLDLEKLVQPLKSKVNPYNIWKDLTTILGKTYIEVKTNNLGDKEIQKEEEPINSLEASIVNTTNKVKTITFLATIKLKKNEIKVEAMLDTGASKNLLFETLVPKEDQQTLTQPVELVQYNQEKIIITKYIDNIPMIINNITMTLPQTYLVPSISLYPFILGLNFVHSLQGGITIQNNQVSFHPKTTTIAYTNTENSINNIVSHYTNKINKIKDSIVNDYSENLKKLIKIKKPFSSSRFSSLWFLNKNGADL